MSRRMLLPALLAWGCAGPVEKAGAEGTTSRPQDSAADSGPGDGDGGDEGSDGGTGSGFGQCGAPALLSTLGPEGCISAASCSWSGSQAYGYLGHEVAAGGDLDGDGVPDIALSATLHDGAAGTDSGRVLLLSGAAVVDGTDGPEGLAVMGFIEGAGPGETLGSTLAFVGDTDGDGTAELALGARGTDPGATPGAGAVLLYSGTTGTVAAPRQEQELARISGTQPWSRVGSSLAGGADADGDGLMDLVLSSALRDPELGDELQGPGRANLFLGRPGGFSGELSIADADAAWAGGGSDMAGHALAMGDLDGDGYAELAVGAPYAVGARGRVTVISGGPSLESGALSDEPAFLDGAASGDVFGWTITIADLTDDGQADLIVGAPLADTGPYHTNGTVTVYTGGAGVHFGMAPTASYHGHWDDQQLGTGLAVGRPRATDAPQLLMGAVDAMHGLQTHAGRAYLAPGGSALTTDVSADSLPTQLHGAEAKDYLGRTAAFADLDGDGQDELILGSAYVNAEGTYDSGRVWLIHGG